MRSVFAVAVLVGCVPGPGDDLEIVQQRTLGVGDLPGLEGEPALVGVAIDPDTDAVVVLDAWGGLYELGDEPRVVASPEGMRTDGGVDHRPFTDAVAMGDGRFAVTVIGDGLLVDTVSETAVVHFCYVPESMPVTRTQQADAVAYDAAGARLFAQPQTFEGSDLVSADVYAYEAEVGGQPVDDTRLPDEKFRAGGMAWDDGALVMGQGTTIHRGLGDDVAATYVDLSAVLDGDVRGLAIDAEDHLHVVTLHGVYELAGWRP